jgi:hypothetical protein
MSEETTKWGQQIVHGSYPMHRLMLHYSRRLGPKLLNVSGRKTAAMPSQMSLSRLGVNYFDHLNREKLTRYFLKRLTRLGHKVTIEPCEASA